MRTRTREQGKIIRIGAKPISEEEKDIKVRTLGPPRCGNHWLHYIIRHLIAPEKVFWGHALTRPYLFKTLFLIIRNPKESIIRHCIPEKGSVKEQWVMSRIDECSKDEYNYQVNNYFNPLYFYEECDRPKHLVYYEDLISDPSSEIRRIASILGVSAENFLADYDNHKEKSIEEYHFGVSRTRGEHVIYHSRLLNPESKQQCDRMFRERHPSLIKYIHRYFEGG